MFILLLVQLLLYLNPVHSDVGTLHLNIENITTTNGMIWVGIYDSKEHFLIKEKAILKGYHIPHTGRLDVYIDGLEFGEYAVAVFHDVNNNGEMDRNLIGIPSEPYAFSQPLRSKWRLPTFDELTFQFNRTGQSLNTTLNKWWKS